MRIPLKTKSLSVPQMIRATDRAIDATIRKKNPSTLYDPPRYLFKGGGKRLRAVMTLLSYGMIRPDIMKALPAAAAVEILHNFSLVHDDIMDHDDLRRGRPTIHKQWNENIAILSGDLLAAKAYQSLSGLPEPVLKKALSIFNDGFIALCEGQALDKEFESRDNVSLKDYRTMIGLKTAALFTTAMRLGAVTASARPKQEQAAADFGRHFGLAFQIQDDLLDITGDEQTLGKDIGSDLIEQKKTYISILVNRHAEGHAWLNRFFKGQDEQAHHDQLKLFRTFLLSSGIQQTVEKTISSHIHRAIAILKSFPDSASRHELTELTTRLWKRRQ